MHGQVLLFFSNLFSTDMVVILVIALMLFGGEKLPQIARGLGKGIRDFKDASEGVKREINAQINSFEEKRAETALDTKAASVQNETILNTDSPVESHPSVENTMPITDYHYNGTESTTSDNHTRTTPVAEHHDAVSHTDAGTTTNEPIKI